MGRPGGAVPPFKRKGNPWRFKPGEHIDRKGIPNKPYRQPSRKRQLYVQKRTGLTPAQQADWCLAVKDVVRVTGRAARTVHDWIAPGRRRYSELTRHKLPVVDYGIGDESRFYTRMQDLIGYAIDWKIPLRMVLPADEVQLQRGRVAFILTRGYDPLPLLTIIRNTQESETHE